MKTKMCIRKVWERRKPHQLIVSIPLDCGIKASDYVAIYWVKPPKNMVR